MITKLTDTYGTHINIQSSITSKELAENFVGMFKEK